jgi:hypothetical protein
MEEKRNVNWFSLGKQEAKNVLGTPPLRWENNEKMRLRRNRMAGCRLGSSSAG